jgi:hypothetical protein
MLRGLVLALLAANLVFFAWTQGWLAPLVAAPRQGESEPGRLAAQVNPERVAVLPAEAASAALAAAPAAPPRCLQAGPLDAAQASAVEAAVADAGLPADVLLREPLPGGAAWGVYAGRFADAAARDARAAEWRRAGLAVALVDAPAALAPGLRLAPFQPSAEAASAALAAVPEALRGSGARAARALAVPVEVPVLALRVAAAEATVATKLQALRLPVPGLAFVDCPPSAGTAASAPSAPAR